MKKNKIKDLFIIRVVLIFLSFHLISCGEKDLSEPLRITNIKSFDAKGISIEDLYRFDSLTSIFIKNESFLKLFDDNTFGVLSKEGDYINGSYSFEDTQLRMDFGKYGVFNFERTVEHNPDTNTDIVVLKGKNKQKNELRILLTPDDKFEIDEIDLLTLDHNWWRVKPLKPESQEQLKKRVSAHLSYMIDYFDLINKKKAKSFEIPHLKSPFRFYANGLGLNKRYDYITSDYFFNSEDASKAYQILQEGFDSIGIYPAGKDTYSEGYKNAMSVIRQHIDLTIE